jgi:hypothetical protein
MKDRRLKLQAAEERTKQFFQTWDVLNKVLERYLKDPRLETYKNAKKYLASSPEISNAFDTLVVKFNQKSA